MDIRAAVKTGKEICPTKRNLKFVVQVPVDITNSTEHLGPSARRTQFKYSRTPLIRINWDGEPSAYAKKSRQLDFSVKLGYIVILNFGCYYLQYGVA